MAGPESSEALDAALDELYGTDPSEFVERRKALAGALRTAGDKQGASAIGAARRPTTAAWALNQLARTQPDVVNTLLDRSRELEAAQMGAGPGGREGVREVTQAHRDALGAATDAALAVLGDRATDAYRTQLQVTLRAAGAEPEVGELLRTGRFVKELTGPSGFPEGFTLTLVPELDPDQPVAPAGHGAPPVRPGAKTSKTPKIRSARPVAAAADTKVDTAARARQEREAAAAAAAERRRVEAEAAWQAALELVDAVATEARAADLRVEHLASELEDAQRDARAAAERVVAAKREAGKLERAATGKAKPKIHRG